MAMSRLLISIFVFSVLLGVISQALLQLSLFAPLNDAAYVGSHLNQYDIESQKSAETKTKKLGNKKNAAAAKVGGDTDKEDDAASVRLDFIKTIDQLGETYGTGANLDNAEARALYHTVLGDTKQSFDAWIDHRFGGSTTENNKKTKKDEEQHSKREEEQQKLKDQDDLEHASVLCSVARSRIRRYTRDRMADRLGAWSLFFRDAWTHGGKYLLTSILSDTTHAVESMLGLSGSEGGEAGEGKGKKTRRSESIELLATGVPFKNNGESDMSKGGEVSKTGATFSSIGACLNADDHSPCPAFSYLRHVRGKDAKAILKSCFNSNEYYDRYFSGKTTTIDSSAEEKKDK